MPDPCVQVEARRVRPRGPFQWAVLLDGLEHTHLPASSDPTAAARALAASPRLTAELARLRRGTAPCVSRPLDPSERSEAPAIFADLVAVEEQWGIPRRYDYPPVSGPPRWDVVWIGCGKDQEEQPERALDLYNGPIFTAHRQVACHINGPYCVHSILSAKHHVVPAGEVLDPYDRTLTAAELRAWSAVVLDQLLALARGRRAFTLLVLAGGRYVDGWADEARRRGIVVDTPLHGLEAGERRAFADRLRRETPGRGGPLDDDFTFSPREQLLGFAAAFRASPDRSYDLNPCPSDRKAAMPMSMYEVSDLRETENRLPELYPDLPGPIGPYGVVRAVARGVLFGNGLMGAPLYWFWFANGNPGVPAWRAHLVVSHEAYLDDFDSGDPRRVASRTEFTRRDMLTLAGMLDGTYTDRDFGFEHPYERVVHEALRVIEECGGASLFASYRLEAAIGLYVARVRGRHEHGVEPHVHMRIGCSRAVASEAADFIGVGIGHPGKRLDPNLDVTVDWPWLLGLDFQPKQQGPFLDAVLTLAGKAPSEPVGTGRKPAKHHTFVWRVGETPRSAKFQQLTPDQLKSAKFLYEAVDSGLIVDVFEIGDELFAASRKGAHNPTWAREVKASATRVKASAAVAAAEVTMSAPEFDPAGIRLRHFAPSFDEMSWNQFVAAVMLAFPTNLTVVRIERGPENLEAMLEYVTPDEFSVSVRVGWDGRDVTAVEIDSDGRMLTAGGGLLDTPTPPKTELLAAVLRMPCVSADQVASRLTALLAQFADTREYPETCGACGTALTDLGAHGVGCPVCAAAELDALDTDSLKLSASELADERAVTAARRARWGGATSWPPSAAPAWLAIGGRVQAPGHDDLDTGAGSNRGTVARIDADQGRVVVETDDGQLEEWPLAGVAPEVDP